MVNLSTENHAQQYDWLKGKINPQDDLQSNKPQISLKDEGVIL